MYKDSASLDESPEDSRVRSALNECWQSLQGSRHRADRDRVRLHASNCGSDEIWAIVRSLLSGQVTMGASVRHFEEEFACSFGFAHAVMVNSGSSANLLAVAVLCHPSTIDPLRPGDEVIVPALSSSTMVWPLVQHGLIPVIVDVDPETLTLNPLEVEETLTPRTRAIFAIHTLGNPCDMKALGRIAREKSLVLLEDCREALGARFAGKSVGSFSRVATFSFSDSRHLSTIEGGMCVTHDFELAELLRSLRGFGQVRDNIDPRQHWRAHPNIDPRVLSISAGYNVRPMELQGAMGSVQLQQLDRFLRIRSENAAWWKEELEPWREILTLQKESAGGESSWLSLAIRLRQEAFCEAKDLSAHLEQSGIDTGVVACGNIAAQPALKAYPHRVVGAVPHANAAVDNGFILGNHQDICIDSREYVARRIHEFLERGNVNLP